MQFHPEHRYASKEDALLGNRNTNLLNNILKFFFIDRKNTDLDKVDEYLQAKLIQSFSNAKSPIYEDTCPTIEGVAPDVIGEAINYAMIT